MKLNAFNLGTPQSRLPKKVLFTLNHAIGRFNETGKRRLLMRVKLVVLIMTTSLLQVAAAGFAQKLTFKQKGATLEQIFKEITKQTGYEVFYADKGISAAKAINVDFKNTDLTDVLNVCLSKQPLSYSIEDNSIVIRIKQKSFFDKVMDFMVAVEVKGRVLDENGGPLPGATIRTKDGSKSTQTNSNGEFQLSGVDENAVLLINYLGYKTREVTVNELEANPSIKMEIRTGELDEVNVMVNTGYQTLPKERATGSFTHISNEQLNQQVGKNIISRLNGVANSVLFDGKSSRPAFTVRGLSSINGNQAPLIILDNFPYEGDINNINPNDVESVDILKDAQASSIWGARAGNGVIVIVTKKGALNKPLQINFNSNVTFTGKPDLFDLKLASASEYIDAEEFLFSKSRYSTKENDKSKPGLSEVIETLILQRDKKITPEVAKARIDALRGNDIRNDAAKYLYNNAVDQQYAIGFQGGSATHTYNISAGYDHGLSTLSDNNDRINLRASNTFKPVDNLQISTTLYYTNVSTKSGKPGYQPGSIGYAIYPYTQLKDANGNDVAMDVYRKPYTEGPGMDKLLDWKYYPLEDYKVDRTKANLQSILANAGLNYEFIKGLSLDLKYQYENQQVKTNILHEESSFYTRNAINRGRDSKTLAYTVPEGSILSNSASSIISQNARAQLNLNKTFGNHSIVAIAGGEVRSTGGKSNSHLTYGYFDDILKTGRVNYDTKYKDFITGFEGLIPDGINLKETRNNFISAFANAAYTYKGKYTISGSARKDQSNIFGVRTNRKGVPLWSAGASWNLSEESFYDVSFLPYLKLRTTYGASGNLDSREAAVTTLVAGGSAFYTQLPQSSIYNYPNPDLRWERAKMFNIAADFQLINNVLSGSIEYYHKKGTDLFGTAEMDYTTTGVLVMKKNVANMKGNGVDITLSSRILNREIKWFQNFNFNYNTNQITKYYKRSDIGADFITSGSRTSAPLVGQPVYSIISYRWAGLDPLTGEPRSYLNGEISKDYTALTSAKNPIENLVYGGSAMPTVFGNFTNTVNWKELSLSVNVTYKMGYSFRRPSVDYTMFNQLGGQSLHADFANRWQKAGDETKTNVPAFFYPNSDNRNSIYNASEILVTKGDHIRLQFINLSYSLKKSQLAKLPFKELQLYTNASNLGILWKANKFDIDPDYLNTFNQRASYALGLRANF